MHALLQILRPFQLRSDALSRKSHNGPINTINISTSKTPPWPYKVLVRTLMVLLFIPICLIYHTSRYIYKPKVSVYRFITFCVFLCCQKLGPANLSVLPFTHSRNWTKFLYVTAYPPLFSKVLQLRWGFESCFYFYVKMFWTTEPSMVRFVTIRGVYSFKKICPWSWLLVAICQFNRQLANGN